jgi:hypothetical protein
MAKVRSNALKKRLQKDAKRRKAIKARQQGRGWFVFLGVCNDPRCLEGSPIHKGDHPPLVA